MDLKKRMLGEMLNAESAMTSFSQGLPIVHADDAECRNTPFIWKW